MGMTLTQESNEIFRMINCARSSSGSDLLDELLNGFSRSIPNVLKMRAFWMRHLDLGYHDASVDNKDAGGVWRVLVVIDDFLKSQLSPEEFKKATIPPLRDPNAPKITDEFDFED